MKAKNRSEGFVLIGAVALAILIAIGGLGYLQISTISLNNDTQALTDLHALCAAESGVNMGLRWLRGSGTFYPASGVTVSPNPFSSLSINGIDVCVRLSANVDGSVNVIGEAYKDPSDGHSMSSATFQKRVGFQEVTMQSFLNYGTFIGAPWCNNPDYLRGATDPVTGYRGFRTRTFNGRFHMNSYIEINSNTRSNLFQNGLVSVARNTNPILNWQGDYGTGASGNKFDFGVKINRSDENTNTALYGSGTGITGTTGLQECEAIFKGRYLANQDMVALPPGENWNRFMADASRITLPPSWEEGEERGHYRPTLQFRIVGGVATAEYHYRNNATDATDRVYTIDQSVYNEKVIVSTNHLNVLGAVRGAVTIATAPQKSIFPVDNLVYESYNPATNSVNATDVIGLVPGKHIRFNNRWVNPSKTTVNIGDPTLASPAPVHNTTTAPLIITASILAVENANDVNRLQGCEYWDNNFDVNRGYRTEERYSFRLFGNHVLAAERSDATGPTDGCSGQKELIHDTRFINESVVPPNYPQVKSVTGLFFLTAKGWYEENVY
jgi:Tfp pilus assembly protein PilX